MSTTDSSNGPPPPPDPTAVPVPVICDSCRATGQAGDPLFGAITDILNFKPVDRRAHVNNWTDLHQRSYVVALAMTGSKNKAARAIGRYANGAEQLRKSPGGREFDRACEAALEIYRDREYYRVKSTLADMAAEHAASLDAIGQPAPPLQGHALLPGLDPDMDLDQAEYHVAIQGIRQRLMGARRLYLATIANDPRKRKAWQVLVGKTDWERARAMAPQENEPFPLSDDDAIRLTNFHRPAMILAVDGGMMNHHLGLPGPVDALKAEFAAAERFRALGHDEAEVRTQLDLRAEYLAQGWTEDENGNLLSPEVPPSAAE